MTGVPKFDVDSSSDDERSILRGELICEYKGKRVPWEVAMTRPPRDLAQPDHTFLFDIGDGYVIDGGVGGNSARWINQEWLGRAV